MQTSAENVVTTCTIFAGKDVFSCKKYFVSVQRKICDEGAETADFLSALAVMFSCYYVFNLEYNPSCVATLEFIQR